MLQIVVMLDQLLEHSWHAPELFGEIHGRKRPTRNIMQEQNNR
jgi:hypothetical protein